MSSSDAGPSPAPVTPAAASDMKLLFVEMGTGYDQHGLASQTALHPLHFHFPIFLGIPHSIPFGP